MDDLWPLMKWALIIAWFMFGLFGLFSKLTEDQKICIANLFKKTYERRGTVLIVIWFATFLIFLFYIEGLNPGYYIGPQEGIVVDRGICDGDYYLLVFVDSNPSYTINFTVPQNIYEDNWVNTTFIFYVYSNDYISHSLNMTTGN